MGGPGSGRWGPGYRRKTTVEECRALEAGLLAGAQGRVVWRQGDRETVSVAFATEDPTAHLVRLSLSLATAGEGAPPVQVVQLVPTPGRAAWWFRCSCGRRVAHLYLPPGELRFGCRTCHGLVYRSSQEAHRHDRFLRLVAEAAGWEGSLGSLRRALEERGRR